ncbi:MAG: MBL fold metallo-hydrolase [Anaerolineae bacterium]|nr:MBL fold metallo-hydrolase [Anaerolineae bacterium]
MKTQDFPYAEIAPNTYEIGEFDCASMFLLIGDDKAMLIDTGVGIGDLKGFVRTLTDKPVMVCYTHNHVDHVGGAGAFDNAYIHPKDMTTFATGGGIGLDVEGRIGYINFIAERQKGEYAYNLDVDVTEWGPQPLLYPLKDEQVIELGNRKVTVYECPGHTAGSICFLDENTRILFLGDAVNCNLGLGGGAPGTPNFTSIEKALFYLKRLYSIRDRYDRYYNGHYDFRALGEPLGEDVLSDAITACEQIVAGTATVEVKPSMFPGAPVRSVVTVGRTQVSFNPEGIHEPQ